MKTNKFELDKIMSIVQLNSELEVEQAESLVFKFKWMQKENEILLPLREHWASLLEDYKILKQYPSLSIGLNKDDLINV